MSEVILEVKNLKKNYTVKSGMFNSHVDVLKSN